MLNNQKHFLYPYSFNSDDFEMQEHQEVARVISEHKKYLKVISRNGVIKALNKGYKRVLKKSSYEDLAYVGDYVVIDSIDHDQTYINHILKRKNIIKRYLASKNYHQVLCTNIDYLFVVSSMDQLFNIKKIDRMCQLGDNAKVIVILTKSDAINTNITRDYINEVRNFCKNVYDVWTSGNNDNSAVKNILSILQPNKTGLFIGSSGVGKSTLTNLLLNKQQQDTQALSLSNNKGVHTTTARSLSLLPGGGCIIDIPGIKEIMINEGNLIDSKLLDLSKKCKFNNCSHSIDKGCAIQEALSSGEITQEQFKHFFSIINDSKLNNI